MKKNTLLPSHDDMSTYMLILNLNFLTVFVLGWSSKRVLLMFADSSFHQSENSFLWFFSFFKLGLY